MTETVRKKTTTVWVDGKDGLLPWSKGKVALAGGVAALALVGGSTAWAVTDIQNTLENATIADLAARGIDTSDLDVSYRYRFGTIKVPAGSDLDAAKLTGAVSDTGIKDLFVAGGAVATDGAADVAPAPDIDAVLEDGKLVLTGGEVTQAERDELVEAATKAFGADAVVDRLELMSAEDMDAGADSRVSDLAAALAGAGKASVLTAGLEDGALTVTAQVPDEATRQDLNGVIDGLSSEATATVTLAGGDSATSEPPTTPAPTTAAPTTTAPTPSPAVADAAAEAASLNAELEALSAELRATVVFRRDSAVLQAPATATLNKVVAAMQKWQLPVVEVAGHTDSSGDDSANQALSEARAAAVRTYLEQAGIPAARLQSVGRGETQPIGPNETAAGRSANRRVALIARPSI